MPDNSVSSRPTRLHTETLSQKIKSKWAGKMAQQLKAHTALDRGPTFQFPAPMIGSSQLPATPAPRDPSNAPSSDLREHCIHTHILAHRYTISNRNEVLLKINKKFSVLAHVLNPSRERLNSLSLRLVWSNSDFKDRQDDKKKVDKTTQ